MALFGKKKEKTPTAALPPVTASVVTIPDAFYGGADPVIHYASESARPAETKTSGLPAPRPQAKKPPKKQRAKKFLFLFGAILLLLAFTGGTAWYYFAGQQTPPPPPPLPTPLPPPVIIPPPEPESEPEPLPEETAPTTTSAYRDKLGQFPPLIVVDSVDTDADTLTDREEELFTTDSGIWDTDADGYYDGQEVVNLYNPVGFAPVRIIDSGLVREYVHPSLGYRLYYPVGWEAANVDAGGEDVIFSAMNGDFVEVRAFEKADGETFETWFGRTVAGQAFSDVVVFSNRFQEDGWRRTDHLVAYFETPTQIIAMIYHPAVEEAIAYRQVMILMRESFRPGRAEPRA